MSAGSRILSVLLICLGTFLYGEVTAAPITFGTITTEVDGWAREAFLLSFLSIDKDASFPDQLALESYLKQKEQKLINKRLFTDVKISYSLDEDNPSVADVVVYVKDGAPVFGLPFYKYNSNYGHQFGAVLWMYDFFGSLTNVMVSGGYSTTSFDDDPFRKVDWDVSLDWKKIDFFNFSWDLSARQQFKTESLVDYETDVYEQFYTYHQSGLDFSTSANFLDLFTYSFKPTFRWKYGYDVTVGDINTSTKLTAGLSHSLGYGAINWFGNMRRGYSVSVGQSFAYDFFEDKADNVLNLRYRGFLPWWIFQLSTQANLGYNLEGDLIGTGGDLRGVLDSRLSGQLTFIENFDISTKLFTVPKIMDVYGGSFIDVGVMKREGRSVDSPYYSAGIEGLFYPLPFKSMTIRGTFGVDMRAFAEGDYSKWELDISQDLFY